jgi:large subunit ribosomal protein L25
MAARSATRLTVRTRQPGGSRAVRRLRRSGRVPGILYGGGGDTLSFEVDARELRHALAASGAVLELSVDGDSGTPAVLREAQRHPVHGETLHIDLVRVRLDVEIHAVVALELTGGDESPGVKDGGILEQVTRELNVEALPTAIPEAITYDVSDMEMNATLLLSAITAPEGVKLLDDPDETLIATLSPPRIVEEEEEIETETEVVGEDGEQPAAEDAESDGDADSGSSSGE